jgi:flavodoxin
MDAAIIYWSGTGNTEKVALVIKESLEANGIRVTYARAEEAHDLDWFSYDLLCLGFPSYQWSPPDAVDKLLKEKLEQYRKLGRIKTGAPKIPGKNAVVFCTYSGPHTGIDEALPACKYAGQYFAHLGFTVFDDWCVVGEFHGSEENSTKGPLGDIRGRPNEKDLAKVKQDVAGLLQHLAR